MTTLSYKSHISSQYNEELEDVRQRVLAMADWWNSRSSTPPAP